MNVLLSIKPKYAELIVAGRKKYEFRKYIFNDKPICWIYLYATSPVKKIVGAFKIGDIIRDHPRNLWYQLNKFSGMDEAEFFDYFKNNEVGYAIEIKYAVTFEDPIDPKMVIPRFSPPQSFCYLKYSLVPERIAIKSHIESRISTSGLTLHDRHSVERCFPADRPALRERQPASSGSPG